MLTPIFDPTFSDSSFGFRPGRNAHQAIRQVQANVKDGRRIAVDIDLAKFFDTVNHDVLMSLLWRTVRDQRCWVLSGATCERELSPDTRRPEDGLCLAKGWACGPARPARHCW